MTNSELKNKIKEICTYEADEDEVGGGHTCGYCLSEEQFQKLFDLFSETMEEVIGEDDKEELQEPYLMHIKNEGTDCCYCSLCGQSEMTIQDSKNKKGEYFCECSVWDGSYERNWLRWRVGEEHARGIRERYHPNARNRLRAEQRAKLNKIIGGKE